MVAVRCSHTFAIHPATPHVIDTQTTAIWTFPSLNIRKRRFTAQFYSSIRCSSLIFGTAGYKNFPSHSSAVIPLMEQNLYIYKASINNGDFLFYSLDRVRLSLLEIKHLMGPLYFLRLMGEWRWSIDEIVLTGENRITRGGKKICSNTSLSPTNSIWIDLKLDPSEKFLSCGTARFK